MRIATQVNGKIGHTTMAQIYSDVLEEIKPQQHGGSVGSCKTDSELFNKNIK